MMMFSGFKQVRHLANGVKARCAVWNRNHCMSNIKLALQVKLYHPLVNMWYLI